MTSHDHHQEERPKTERGARSRRFLEPQIGPVRSYDGLDVGILRWLSQGERMFRVPNGCRFIDFGEHICIRDSDGRVLLCGIG